MDLEKDKAGRNRLQNYVLLPLYLTLSLWQELMDPAIPPQFVLTSLAQHCVMLGLKFPSESTYGMVYTLLNYKTPQKFKEPSLLYQDYAQVKSAFKDSLLRSRTSLQVIPGQYLLELPPVWQDLPMDMLDKVFGNEAPIEPKISMKHLQGLQQSIPLRQSHRLVDLKLAAQPAAPAWLSSIMCALSKMSPNQDQSILEYSDGHREALPCSRHVSPPQDHQPDPVRVTKCLTVASSAASQKALENVPEETKAIPQKTLPIMDKVPADMEKASDVSWLYFFVFFVLFCLFLHALRLPLPKAKSLISSRTA